MTGEGNLVDTIKVIESSQDIVRHVAGQFENFVQTFQKIDIQNPDQVDIRTLDSFFENFGFDQNCSASTLLRNVDTSKYNQIMNDLYSTLQALQQIAYFDVAYYYEMLEEYGDDPDLINLIEMDVDEYFNKLDIINSTLVSLQLGSIPSNRENNSNHIVISGRNRFNESVDELSEYVQSLVQAYMHLANVYGLKVQLLDLDETLGDFTMMVYGNHIIPDPMNLYIDEEGNHKIIYMKKRVQGSSRMRKEKQSTAILDIRVDPGVTNYEEEIDENNQYVHINTSKASGPGGQHAQKNETGVTIIYDDGMVNVSAKSTRLRSQKQNLIAALSVLNQRIKDKIMGSDLDIHRVDKPVRTYLRKHAKLSESGYFEQGSYTGTIDELTSGDYLGTLLYIRRNLVNL